MRVLKNRWGLTVLSGVGVGVAIALLFALIGRGSFVQIVFNFIILVWGIPLFVLVMLITGLIWWRQGKRWAARVTRGAIAGLMVVVAQFAAVPLGVHLAEADIAKAKAYCESLIPKLQAHHAQQGQYPERITDLNPLPALPRLLQGEEFYWGSEEEFSFFISDPAALLGAWEYDSAAQQWRYVE